MWLRTAANGLHIVYNDTENFNGLGPLNRSFIVKYLHLIDVLQKAPGSGLRASGFGLETERTTCHVFRAEARSLESEA